VNRIPVSYAVQAEKTSPKWACAFARGCGGEAIPATRDTVLRPEPAAFFGSPELWTNIIKPSLDSPLRTTYFGDHAYFKRQQYYKVTKNRLQHDGVPRPGIRYDPDRLRIKAGVQEIHPWRQGSAVVICPNSPTYMALFGIDAQQWVLQCIETLSRYTDRPMIVRWKAQAQRRPLYHDLHDAWAVVVFSSNSAVEGLVAGVPCVTLAPFAASRRMGRTRLDDIENPVYPDDRQEFLTVLAHNQWSLDEMSRGDAWKALRGQ
jgi:hypothetical protein